MKRDVASGILLIVGAATGILVMSLHPTAHTLLQPGAFAHLAHLNGVVHGLALAAVPALVLGLVGLTRRLAWSELGVAALVVYAFASVAVTSAAVASGFVATDVIGHMMEAEGGARDVYHALMEYTGMINQAFAKVYVVATSVAFFLWSASILKSRLLPRAVGHAGVIVAGAVLLAFFGGKLRLNVHGFGIVVFLQAVWLIWIGILLCRSQD